MERLTFQRMHQKEAETSDDFITRLTNQAKLCKFKECDERIIEQITYGTRHAEVQKTILMEDEQGKSEGFDSCDRPSNLTQIGFKSFIFHPVCSGMIFQYKELGFG